MSEWIPVSERLPKEDGDYFVTAVMPKEMGGAKMVYVDRFIVNDYYNGYGEPTPKGWQHERIILEYTAWMPLPEPYEAE